MRFTIVMGEVSKLLRLSVPQEEVKFYISEFFNRKELLGPDRKSSGHIIKKIAGIEYVVKEATGERVAKVHDDGMIYKTVSVDGRMVEAYTGMRIVNDEVSQSEIIISDVVTRNTVDDRV